MKAHVEKKAIGDIRFLFFDPPVYEASVLVDDPIELELIDEITMDIKNLFQDLGIDTMKENTADNSLEDTFLADENLYMEDTGLDYGAFDVKKLYNELGIEDEDEVLDDNLNAADVEIQQATSQVSDVGNGNAMSASNNNKDDDGRDGIDDFDLLDFISETLESGGTGYEEYSWADDDEDEDAVNISDINDVLSFYLQTQNNEQDF